jgi:arginine-tRNA-protein transferase
MTPIFDEFYADFIESEQLDSLLEIGFRHFGKHFFRYSHNYFQEKIVSVLPLRINLEKYKHSNSQKKIIKKNQILDTRIIPCILNDEIHELFELHSNRFEFGKPSSIFDFINIEEPSQIPNQMFLVEVRQDSKLLAGSFLDNGESATSSIYGMFHPDYYKYSLGIYTMLLEIEWSISNKKKFYYPGYAYTTPSFYDYKKQFYGLEALDFGTGTWFTYERNFPNE